MNCITGPSPSGCALPQFRLKTSPCNRMGHSVTFSPFTHHENGRFKPVSLLDFSKNGTAPIREVLHFYVFPNQILNHNLSSLTFTFPCVGRDWAIAPNSTSRRELSERSELSRHLNSGGWPRDPLGVAHGQEWFWSLLPKQK